MSQKTKELFIYIANKLADTETYGATMLNKAFYFIDNIYYLKTGRPITNFKYIKQDFGPTPNPKDFLKLKDQLITNKEIYPEENIYFDKVQKRCIATREANKNVFLKDEIDVIDKVLDILKGKNATEISRITHDHPSWQFADDGEELPFYSFLLSSTIPSDEDLKWANNSIKEYKTICN